MSDDDNDDANVKHARTASGGDRFSGRRLDGGLGEAALPPVRERKRKLPEPPFRASSGN